VSRRKTQLCLFILSGEHDTLPQAELCAILESEGFSYSITHREKQLVLMEVNSEGARMATQRAALVNHSSAIAFESGSKEGEILQSLQQLKIPQWIRPNTRFGVRVTRVQREPIELNIDDLQGKIGSVIWQAMKGEVEVSLRSPDTLFLGVINGNQFFFGRHLASRSRRSFSERRSPLRPFFVPSAIHPKIARVLVNLSRARPGSNFLDPFCGTGGLLLEAAEIGCIPIGSDIDKSMLIGSQQNLSHFGVFFYGIWADARMPPLRTKSFEAIATDPPYGRSSSTKGTAIISLIQTSLASFAKILKPRGCLCLALPLRYFTEDMIPSDSFIIKETHTMRIHRSLQRHIVVLERK
jgi:tRNA (guanine10-N2)-dimethyltransferase